MKKKFSTFALLVIALVVSSCGSQPASTTATPTSVPAGTVIAEGHIRPMQSVNLAFQGSGEVNLRSWSRLAIQSRKVMN